MDILEGSYLDLKRAAGVRAVLIKIITALVVGLVLSSASIGTEPDEFGDMLARVDAGLLHLVHGGGAARQQEDGDKGRQCNNEGKRVTEIDIHDQPTTIQVTTTIIVSSPISA